MANRQTRSLRKRGLSLKFNHGVDCTGADHSDRPEIQLVERPLIKGRCVNSTTERRKRAYTAPTITKSKPKGSKKR